jgi:Ca2+-binding EF-hand superfamily protein
MRILVSVFGSLLIATGAQAQSANDILFLSPMGEPFRGSAEAPPEVQWFDGADANHDGRLSVDDMTDDADRFFKLLDLNHDGEIGPNEIEHYETTIVPEVSASPVGQKSGIDDPSLGGEDSHLNTPAPNLGRYQASGGAALFSYLGLPEPVIAADTNFNRGVSAQEFERAATYRFGLLDKNRDGKIDRAELPAPPRRKAKRGRQ